MSIQIDGRKASSHAKDIHGNVILVNKVSKDNYSLSYFQGVVFAVNLSKSEAENVLSFMSANYFSNVVPVV